VSRVNNIVKELSIAAGKLGDFSNVLAVDSSDGAGCGEIGKAMDADWPGAPWAVRLA
jgi:hypothetical protein